MYHGNINQNLGGRALFISKQNFITIKVHFEQK